MAVNSVQQKNLVDIIKNGCVHSGINMARRAAMNIVKALKSKNDAAAMKIGAKYDRRTAAVDKKIESVEKKATKDVAALDDLLFNFRADIQNKQAKIVDKKRETLTALQADKDAIVEDAKNTDHIRIGTGNRTYNHIHHCHEEEPNTWVICDNHPKASELTDASVKLNEEIRDMENEVELIQHDLWLCEEIDDAKACINRLKKVRDRYNAIIKKDPETATLN